MTNRKAEKFGEKKKKLKKIYKKPKKLKKFGEIEKIFCKTVDIGLCEAYNVDS